MQWVRVTIWNVVRYIIGKDNTACRCLGSGVSEWIPFISCTLYGTTLCIFWHWCVARSGHRVRFVGVSRAIASTLGATQHLQLEQQARGSIMYPLLNNPTAYYTGKNPIMCALFYEQLNPVSNHSQGYVFPHLKLKQIRETAVFCFF